MPVDGNRNNIVIVIKLHNYKLPAGEIFNSNF